MYVHDYLVKARHDDLMRTCCAAGLPPQARRAHRLRRYRVIAAPTRRLALIRPRKTAA